MRKINNMLEFVVLKEDEGMRLDAYIVKFQPERIR